MKHILKEIKDKSPLIHAITNPISINMCANIALALGARPIMAEHPEEVFDITAQSRGLLLNLGNITDVRMKSMRISAESANIHSIPIVLDLVGVACSVLRKSYAKSLLDNYNIQVIKGNYSEIYSLFCDFYSCDGVDADKDLNVDKVITASEFLAKKYNLIVIATGATDIVAGPEKIHLIYNGTDRLCEITGSGCLLGMIVTCCVSVCMEISAVTLACAILGICGELSVSEKGNGSFYTKLWDMISIIDYETINKHIKSEERLYEEI